MPTLDPLLYPDILELHATVSELVKMKLLQKIDTSKAPGPNLIPARILKDDRCLELTPILTSLF